MLIGKIASATSHVDLLCQVYGPGDAEVLPQPADYGFGAFVGVEVAEYGRLVGVVHNTTLFNPEFGDLGPRLSPRQDLAVFTPDYLAEKVTLAALAVLGQVDANGVARQGVPVIAAHLDAPVRTLTEEEVVAFHRTRAGVRASYLPMLATLQTPLAPHLVESILSRLCALFPSDVARLSVLRDNVSWRSRVQAVG
jgi:phage tail protein X